MFSWSELLYDKKRRQTKKKKSQEKSEVSEVWLLGITVTGSTKWTRCSDSVSSGTDLNQTPPEHFLCPLLIFTTCDSFWIHVILYKRRRYILYRIMLWNIFWRTSTRSEPVPRSREMLLCRVWISWLVDWSSGRWFCRARWRRWHESEDRFIRSSHRRCPRCWCRPPAGTLLHSRAPQIDFCCRVFKRQVDGFIQYLSKKAKQTRD